MLITQIELNRTGRGFHIKGNPGASPADLLEATIGLLREYATPLHPNEAGHDYHLQLDDEQVDRVKENGEGRIAGRLYDPDKLHLVERGEHAWVTGTRPIAEITLQLKTATREDYGGLQEVEYAVRAATIATPYVFAFVQGYTNQGQEDPLRTRELQGEIVQYGQQRLGLGSLHANSLHKT